MYVFLSLCLVSVHSSASLLALSVHFVVMYSWPMIGVVPCSSPDSGDIVWVILSLWFSRLQPRFKLEHHILQRQAQALKDLKSVKLVQLDLQHLIDQHRWVTEVGSNSSVARFGPWVDQIGPKRDKPGHFQIRFQYILAWQAKMYWNLIWKSSVFVSFGQIWPNLGPNPLFLTHTLRYFSA